MCGVLLNSMHSSEERERERERNSVQRCYKCVVFC